MYGIARIRSKAALAVMDNNGNERAYLVPFINRAYHVYASNGQYYGAGMSLESAISMAREKSGIAHEELPSVRRSDVRIVRGQAIKINGFQGGGWYRHDTVYLGDQVLGTFYTKQQPARRHNNTSHTSVYGLNGCVMGHDLSWLLRQHGYRIEERDNDYAQVV